MTLVVLFHFFPHAVPGGFVGVTVFFVLSGYLISSNVAASLSEQCFSFSEFYRRRFLRISPAVLVTVAAVVAVGFVVLDTSEALLDLLGSGVAGALGAANFFFLLWSPVPYFAERRMPQPLLHLWSLGVEEQFYLVLPLLMALLHNRSGRTRMAVLVVIAAASVAGAIFYGSSMTAYYMLPFRCAELLVGVITAEWERERLGAELPSWASSASVVALVAILVSALWYDAQTPFPSFAAMLPAAATAVIVGVGDVHGVNAMLADPLLGWIGRVSFSLYLVHWPLAVVADGLDAVPGARVALVAASVVLGYVSLRFVEETFRRSKTRLLWVMAVRVGVAIALVLALWAAPSPLGVMAGNDGNAVAGTAAASKDHGATQGLKRWPFLEPTPKDLLHLEGGYHIADYSPTCPMVCEKGLRMKESEVCAAGRNASVARALKFKTLLWGDSHAAHYVPLVHSVADKLGVAFDNSCVPGCAPVDTLPVHDGNCHFPDLCNRWCTAMRRDLGKTLTRYGAMILGGAWTHYHEVAMEHGLTSVFRRFPHHRILVLGQVAEVASMSTFCSQVNLIANERQNALCAASYPLTGQEKLVSTNLRVKLMTASFPHVRYWDANDVVCPRGRCRAYTPWGHRLFGDKTHLSCEGSLEIGYMYANWLGPPEAIKWVLGVNESVF